MRDAVTRLCAMTALVLCLAAPAGAFNLGYLRESPLSNFTDEELQTFLDTLRTSLNNGQDGDVVTWGDSESPRAASGSIKILKTEDRGDGTTCRDVHIENRAGGRFGGGVYRLCRDDGGEWKVAH